MAEGLGWQSSQRASDCLLVLPCDTGPRHISFGTLVPSKVPVLQWVPHMFVTDMSRINGEHGDLGWGLAKHG